MTTQLSPAPRVVRGTQHTIVNLAILGTLAWVAVALAIAALDPGLDPLLPLVLAAAGLAWLPFAWMTSNLALLLLRARPSYGVLSGPRQGAIAALVSAPVTFAILTVWFAAS